jgi:predicted Ser/Thr protein kinase
MTISKWFSRSKKGEEKASRSPMAVSDLPAAVPDSIQDSLDGSLAPERGASTVILRAEPATLAIGGHGPIAPPVANAFDAATMMIRPGARFDQATFVRPPAPAPAALAAPDLPLPAGAVLNGRYEVIKPIGRGGFSYVYLCQHQRNGRLNAVKEAYGPGCGRAGTEIVDNDGTALRLATEALLREVSAISRINHPGVVRFDDVFEANGTLYFAMDFVEGEPLSDLLGRRRGVSADTFALLAASLLDAVQTLHSNEVLHGDIKPGNVIVRPDKSVVLIDFGTAARLSDIQYTEPIFSPGYSAPERYMTGGNVGTWSDVYSCAATFGAAWRDGRRQNSRVGGLINGTFRLFCAPQWREFRMARAGAGV